MSEQANVPARLREGIDAAKRGDKLTARRLLQQVLTADGDNELALMWMASVVDSLNERRFYLERALSINPNNNRAREALRRLGVSDPQARPSSQAAAGQPTRRSRSSTNLYLIAAAVVGIVIIAVIVASVVAALQSQQPTPGAPQDVQLTFAALLQPTSTPTIDRRPATLTALPGIIVTFDSSLITPLPPTFTPTDLPTPTPTIPPTQTPLPLSSFAVIYSDIEQGASAPSLYQGRADGTGEVKLQSGVSGGFTDVAVDPTGRRIAFVRQVKSDSGEPAPQLFVASVNSPQDATQISKLGGGVLVHPAWSPDGSKLVFSSDAQGGNQELYLINPDGSNLKELTTNAARDFDPSFSPDGTHIVYASDVNSPGFTEIYTMTVDGAEITQLTDVPNSYSPAWSPDGARIAYVNDQQGSGDIYVMDADGQRPALITQDDNGAENRTPVWSPDGHWILFASNRAGQQFGWYAADLQGHVQPVILLDRNPESLSFVTR